MNIIIKAKLIDNHGGEVVLEIPGLRVAYLDFGGKPKLSFDDGQVRELTQTEVGDLEACLDEFHTLQMGRALAAHIKIGQRE